jgi:DNA-binding GntR family transcriptional regulator
MKNTTHAQPLPVYQQIAELLARQIKAGYWHTGERLPTEAALAQTLGVAVGTLRKSLALLEQQGVLERIQGSGTYVKTVQGTSQIYELFRLELKDGPGLPTAQIMDLALRAAEPSMPPLDEDTHHGCWRVRRLRYLSEVPVALEEIWFSAAACPDLTRQELGDSMYLFYQQRLNIWISRVEDHLSAAPAPDWGVLPWTMKAGDCAGYAERTSWTASNRLAEYSRTWFDPRVCRYTSRLSQ